MNKKTAYMSCANCDGDIEADLVLGPTDYDDYYDWPDECPHCHSAEFDSGMDSDEREDFHADV